jgi:hypothetical protein
MQLRLIVDRSEKGGPLGRLYGAGVAKALGINFKPGMIAAE